jgi:hypothetical protein
VTRRGRNLGVALVCGIASLTAVACGERAKEQEDPVLRAILADPLASYTPPGGRSVQESQRKASSYLKPSPARVTRLFSSSDQKGADLAQDALAARARSGGWDLPTKARGNLHEGWKELAGSWVRLTIADYDAAGEVRVSVFIEDCQCMPTR